jgi:ADP-L-glycero-D-manno-heptose 6-epimerase
MEELAKEQQNTTLGLRYFNVFGPNEFHKKSYANMVTQIILKASRGEEIRLFRSGEQRRDEIYVKDAVAATIYLGEKKLPQKHTVVNIGVGQAETFNNIIFEVSQILDKDIKPMFINNPYSSFYQENTKADITLLKKLGFKHKYTFRQGLKEYIHWLKEVKVIK